MALVALLRGVNVGGHKTFRPKLLAEELAALDVVNIGAAGTFVVHAPIPQAKLREELIRRLPFDTTIMICRGRDVLALTSRERFAGQPQSREIVRFVSTLARSPRSIPSMPLALPASGRWMLKILGSEGRFVFGVHRREIKAIGRLGEIDRIFGSAATTRNWNTFVAIAEALDRARPSR